MKYKTQRSKDLQIVRETNKEARDLLQQAVPLMEEMIKTTEKDQKSFETYDKKYRDMSRAVGTLTDVVTELARSNSELKDEIEQLIKEKA